MGIAERFSRSEVKCQGHVCAKCYNFGGIHFDDVASDEAGLFKHYISAVICRGLVTCFTSLSHRCWSDTKLVVYGVIV